MKIKLFGRIGLLLLFIPLFVLNVYAKGDKKSNENSLNKVTGTPNSTRFNINKIATYIYNDGRADVIGSNPGYFYPTLGGHTANFQSGFLWGGYVGDPVDDQLRVGGAVYRSSLTPGRILPDGTAEDPSADNVRIFRVRKDYKTGSLAQEAQDEGRTEEQVYKQYEKDWIEWPADQGAPFEDVNNNKIYEPSIDIPGVPGADQTIWFVANDLSNTAASSFYGTTPMGIELQCTVWGYKQAGALGQMLFKKYLMVNKNKEKKAFNKFYVSYWSDTDIGGGLGDLIGCDTSKSLFYTYSGVTDNVQYASNPPATGFDFFQGPRIYTGNPADTAIFKGQYMTGYKNMPLTAHTYFINGSTTLGDPDQNSAIGTRQWYNLFQGKISVSGDDFKDPNGNPTKFVFPGDPVNGTGWLDSNPDDRRNEGVSGPFTLAYGDTQEVVIAQMSAGATSGIDNIGAVRELKKIDEIAQTAYNRFFKLPTAAPMQVVKITPLDQKLVLNWGVDQEAAKATENFLYELNTPGLTTNYKFQGYNVYQLPTRSASMSEAIKIKTFDLIDNVTAITDLQPDKSSGLLLPVVVANGINSGLSRYLIDTVDAFTKAPFINGTEYYFAVTSYSYNPNPQFGSTVLENPLVVVTAVPQSSNPGIVIDGKTDEKLDVNHSEGLADGGINVKVVDPTQVTGHEYEVFFNQRHYYLDSNGKWQTTQYPDSIGKKLGKVKDVSPSSLSGVAVYAKPVGSLDINFILDLVSPTEAYVDGIKLTFPADLKINNAPGFAAGNGSISPVINGNVIDFGLVNQDTTQNGAFAGGETFKVNVSNYTLPFTINYTIYDDGYGNEGAPPSNATGTITIDKIGNKFVTQNHWNVKDLTTGEVKLADQTIVRDKDLYYTDPADGPGGSLGYIGANVGSNSQPVVDGLQITLDGSYDSPVVPSKYSIKSEAKSKVATGSSPSATATVFADYTLYGGATSWAIEGFGFGTDVIDELQQDYEIRYTGVLQDEVINGVNVRTVASGGQMATIFSTDASVGLANHPLNPSPGTNAPFLIRLPFEVWNKDTHKQVNLMFRDRAQKLTANPWLAWNSEDRNYLIIVNSDYDPNKVIEPGSPESEKATWVVVMYSTRLVVGDVVTISYDNPLQLGKDKFRFTAPSAASFKADQAKADVEKINVFPNPYYGVNPREVNKYSRFVTFSHLPDKATIRIFNLAGQLVKTIQKEPEDGQFKQWDLLTDNNFPVASGLYIVHIDMPELGKTKILKVAIIQEQQILDHF